MAFMFCVQSNNNDMKTTHNIFMKIIFILTLCMGWGSAAMTHAQEPTKRGLTFVSSSDAKTSGEWAGNMIDGTNNKWGNSWNGTAQWLIVKSTDGPIKLKRYVLKNANDTHSYKARQWKSWTIEGSKNGTSGWTVLETKTDYDLPCATAYQENSFDVTNDASYEYYRVTVSAINNGGASSGMQQMAEITFFALDASDLERAEAMESVTQQIGDANDATWTAFVEARTTFAGAKTEANAQAVLTAYTNWKSSITTNLYLPDGYYYMKGMATARRPYLFANYPEDKRGYTHHSDSYTLTNNYLWKVERVGDTGIRMVNGQGVPLWTDNNVRQSELTFGARNGTEGIYFTQAINLRNDGNNGTLTTWASGGNSAADNRWTFLTPEMGGKEIYTVRLVNAPANTYITYDGQYAMDGGFFLASATPTVENITAADIDATHKVLSRSIDTVNKTITIRYGAEGQVYMTYNVYHGSVAPANLLFTMECAETPDAAPTYGGYTFPTYLDVTNAPNPVPSTEQTFNLVTTMKSTAPFQTNTAQVYTMRVKPSIKAYVVSSSLHTSVDPSASTPNTYMYGWKITGDWYNGFYFQNADTDEYLNTGREKVQQVTFTANKAEAVPLELDPLNASQWLLRAKGTNYWLNRNGSYVSLWSSKDEGSAVAFAPIEDLHYLADFRYMWNGQMVHEIDGRRVERDGAFPESGLTGYTVIGNPTVDGDEVTSVHGVGPYEFQLRKNTRVVNGIEAEITVGVTHEIDNIFPGLKVVDFEGHDLVAGGYNLTVGSAGECVSIDGSTITGTARSAGTHSLGVDLTSEALALYNAPATGFPSVRVLQGLARVRFKKELIILDYGDVDGAVKTMPLSEEDFIFEPTAAKESFTLTDLHVVTAGNESKNEYRIGTTGAYNLRSHAVTTEDLIVQPTLTSNDYDIEVPPTAKLRVYDLEKYTLLTNTLHDIHSYKIGDELGEYSYTGTTPNDETGNAGYESYWSDLYRQGSNLHGIHKVEEEEGINTKIAELHTKVTSFQTDVQTNTRLNMPEAGKTLLTIDDGTDIYYYDEAKGLLAYTQAATANSESVAHGQYRTGGTGITFAGVPNANRAVKGQYKMSTTDETLYELNSVPSLPYTISASGNGYGTLYAPVALKIPAGVKAYVEIKEEAPEAGIAKIKLAPLASIIPAQTAVILKGVAGETYNFPVTTSTYEAQNIFFAGTYLTQPISGSYTLQPTGATVGFYTWASSVTGFRAYIPDNAPDAGRVRAYVLDFGDGTETGIETILGTTSPATPAYDLSGRQIQPTQRGLYLQQGRKVLRN